MAAVIKATPASETTSEVSPENFGFEDISQPQATKADVYLDGVRQHAAEIISSAHTEVSRIHQEAFLQGNAPQVRLESTHIATLEWARLDDLKAHEATEN